MTVAWLPTGEIDPDIPSQFFTVPRVFRRADRAPLWTAYFTEVDNTASHYEVWDFLAEMVRPAHIKTIVEAGTYRGHGTFAMAESLYLGGRTDAHLWTADVEDHGVQNVLDAMDLTRYVSFFHGRFEAMLNLVTIPIDFAFVDASELDRPMLRLEYLNLLLPRMSPHGLAVVDDSTDDEWTGAKLLRQQANLYLPLGRGLTIFQGLRT